MMDPGEGSSSTSKSRKQRFRDAWIEQPEFQGWLAAVPGDPFRAFCKVCSASMVAGSSELKKHAERQGHKKAMLGLQKQHLLTGFIQKKPKDSMDDKVKMAEIKLSAFITEHSLSFKVMDHMGELVKTVFPDSKIAEQVRLHKTKCTSIVKNVLAKAEVQSLSAILRKTRFSLFVDEGTDVSSTKLLCCVVRYYCDAVDDVITQLLEVIPLDATSCSAESLATAVEQCLNHKEIPMKNIIALACDNASVMVGEHNSLMTRLHANADRSFVTIRCICHSLHIAASKAAMKLPRNLEDLLKNVASYFGHSCKRQAQLADLQEYLKTEKHRILKPSETRWLALQKCVERVFQEWDTLKLLFLQASVEDRVAAAGQILAE
ncbi:uncharacterized protein LOC121835415, partial [Ixodes scapularis]|uniref:uncharacterized protein LOC121835415 n=1 Tax=Ixodes scapularis TaxID=6945 RepID=UPI001C3890CF